MAALVDVPAAPLASRFVEPLHRWLPPDARVTENSKIVADLAAAANFAPDDEQQLILDAIFAQRPDGTSVAFEVSVICSRQNIKTSVFEMAALGWLYVTDERLVVWTAHEFLTAQETFLHLEELVTSTPMLSRELRHVSHANGDEGIELKSGSRLIFKTRTKGGARGLSGDKVILDEAYALRAQHMGALLPVMSAQPDGQVLYGSSAGMADSGILRDIRDRGRAGGDPTLAYFEWCAPPPKDACAAGDACTHARSAVGCGCDDPRFWQMANPAMGRRIREQAISAERRALPPSEFGRERMGWWDDPAEGMSPITTAAWTRGLDGESEPENPVALAVTIAYDRSMAAVGVAGWRGDGRVHAELVDHRPGSAWVLDRIDELWERHEPCCLVINPSSPAGALEKQLLLRGWAAKPGKDEKQLLLLGSRDYAQACGGFADDVANDRLRHLGQKPLDDAVEGVRIRESAGAWIWSNRDSLCDITPLTVVTEARQGLMVYGRKADPPSPFFLVGR